MSPGHLLLLQTKFLGNRVVAALVVLFQVAQMRAAVSDHLEKATAGVVILVVFLQVLGQLINTTSEHSNLNVRRTGVRVVAGRIFDNGRLYALCKHGSPIVPHLVKKRKCFLVKAPCRSKREDGRATSYLRSESEQVAGDVVTNDVLILQWSALVQLGPRFPCPN